MKAQIARRRWQGGIALLEALVAVAIVGFGLIAIGKFQSLMLQNSGFTREQTVALKLAQSKIEDLKAFQTIAIATGLKSYDEIISGSDPVTSGATEYTRSWVVAPRTTPGEFKEIVVSVAWTDLRGLARSIQTAALILADNPVVLASAVKNFTKPGNPVLPFNRVLKVPIPAIDQGDGTSVFAPPGSTGVEIQLDNESGNVVGLTGGSLVIPVVADPTVAFFLVSGFVGFNGNQPADENSDIDFLLVYNSDGTLLADHECWDDSALSSGAKAHEDYITYTCVVKSNGSVSIDGEAKPAWSGTMRLRYGIANVYGWGTTNSHSKICRYAGTRHPYVSIAETLASQNYIAIRGDRVCPTSPNETFQFQPAPAPP